MSGDACATKMMLVEIQENGIIRDANGYIIARLNRDISWDELPEQGIEEPLQDIGIVPAAAIEHTKTLPTA